MIQTDENGGIGSPHHTAALQLLPVQIGKPRVLLDGRRAAARHAQTRRRLQAQQLLDEVLGVRGKMRGKLVPEFESTGVWGG